MISAFDDLVSQAVSILGPPSGLTGSDFFALINALIARESSFNPNVSPDGDHIGLMQVSASVFGYDPSVLYDPWTNILAGAQVIKNYINSYGLISGLGAYNQGPTGSGAIFGTLTKAASTYANQVLGFFNTFRKKLGAFFSSDASQYVDPSMSDFASYDIPVDSSGVDSGLIILAALAALAGIYIV
jgi:hypothetical protein